MLPQVFLEASACEGPIHRRIRPRQTVRQRVNHSQRLRYCNAFRQAVPARNLAQGSSRFQQPKPTEDMTGSPYRLVHYVNRPGAGGSGAGPLSQSVREC